MLKKLELEGTGPAPHLGLEFQERLNVITGDNGLGKSFLLDVAWWCLTTWWASVQAVPRHTAKRAAIRYNVLRDAGAPLEWAVVFDWLSQKWPIVLPRDRLQAMVLYARVDGSFSVWDPMRPDSLVLPVPREPEPLHFDARALWDGLNVGDRRPCEGLIRDVVSWQKGREPEFTGFRRVLESLSVPGEEITIGKPRRVSVGDGFDTPTLRTLYDPSVPLTHASAGVRRIAGLAYLLVWAWREHRLACELLRRDPVRRAVLLVDEPECHLHPRWQRLIVPAILRTTEALLGDGRGPGVGVQILAATHSPLVLASLEPLFDPQRDRVFTLDLGADKRTVVVEQPAFRRMGDVNRWLTSEAFDLDSPRSREGEDVLREAEAVLARPRVNRRRARQVDARLRALLGEADPFWLRWRFVGERAGWLPATGATRVLRAPAAQRRAVSETKTLSRPLARRRSRRRA